MPPWSKTMKWNKREKILLLVSILLLVVLVSKSLFYDGYVPQTKEEELAIAKVHEVLKDSSYQKKLAFEVDEKRIIGRVTAELIAEGDTVFLDKGTTVAEVARAMHDKKDLTVITDSLAVAEELKSQHFIDLVIIGGVLERSLMGMAGPLALEGIRKFKFDKAVIGIGGLSVKHGLTT